MLQCVVMWDFELSHLNFISLEQQFCFVFVIDSGFRN